MATKPLPSAEYLRQCFIYNPNTGTLIWKWRPKEHFASNRAWKIWNLRYPGNVAGTRAKHGYIGLIVSNRHLYAHRVIWTMQTGTWPVAEIDHRDRDRANNRLHNLGAATRHENMRNRPEYRPKHPGLPRGVYPKSGRFQARVWITDRSMGLGTYDTADEAHTAWLEATKCRTSPTILNNTLDKS